MKLGGFTFSFAEITDVMSSKRVSPLGEDKPSRILIYHFFARFQVHDLYFIKRFQKFLKGVSYLFPLLHPPILSRPPDTGEIHVPSANNVHFDCRRFLVVWTQLFVFDAFQEQSRGVNTQAGHHSPIFKRAAQRSHFGFVKNSPIFSASSALLFFQLPDLRTVV